MFNQSLSRDRIDLICLFPNVMGAIVEIENFNFAIGGRNRFQVVISAQLPAKEQESIQMELAKY